MPYTSRRTYSAITLLIVVGLPFSAQAQQATLSEADDIAHSTDAVLVSAVTVNGKAIETGRFVRPPLVIEPVAPFQAGTDWLEQTTISLVNRTSQVIQYGSIILHFLDTGDCQSTPCAMATLHFGKLPPVDAFDNKGQPLPPQRVGSASLEWKPEQTVVIRLADHLPEIQQQLANFLPITAVSNVKMYRGVFAFDDGMLWTLGRFMLPDSAQPGKFNKLPADYFPGHRDRNWPPGYNR